MSERILLAHGSGGRLSHELIRKYLAPPLANPILDRMDDSAVFNIEGRIAFTTDSYVVSPIFFPGGDIGKLAVCGTINDLAMCGATPRYLSLALIIEEGLPLDELEKVIASVKRVADEAGVRIVTGDTKVVNRGSADRLFINTAGIGVIPPGIVISGSNAHPGDAVILSGSIGDHGIAVMSKREGFRFNIPVDSDCAPLTGLVNRVLEKYGTEVRSLRDPTRGGLATTLNELAAQSRARVRIEEDRIVVSDAVAAACEMLGLDPLYVANEGKLVAIVSPEHAADIVKLMREHPLGARASIIGEVVEGRSVVMKTRLGSSRILDMLSGELLPRIC